MIGLNPRRYKAPEKVELPHKYSPSGNPLFC